MAAEILIYPSPESDGGVRLVRDTAGDRADLLARGGAVKSTRPCTDTETAELTTVENEATIRAKARQALDVNATFLARTSPTNAQKDAQVRALTRECNALIRLVLGLLDDAADT